jgi:hypothetical protein
MFHGTAGKMREDLLDEELFMERNDSRFLSTLNDEESESKPSEHDEYGSTDRSGGLKESIIDVLGIYIRKTCLIS